MTSPRTDHADAVFLDSMTIQGVARLLSAPKGELPDYYRSINTIDPSDWKWDYSLNEGFRLACDVACLSQFVQSVILHETIVVDSDYEVYLYTPNREPLAAADDVGRFLNPLRVSPEDRKAHLGTATAQSLRYAQSAAFADYLGLLSTSSLEAPFLHVSHHYFGTGYSDPAIFGYREFYRPPRESPEARQKRLLNDPDAYAEKEEQNRRILDLMRDQYGRVLSKTPQDPGDVDDKARAAVDVVKNLHAALYYQSVADSLSLIYMPHPLRSSFALFDLLVETSGMDLLGERLLAQAATRRKVASEPINELFGKEIIHYDVPLFLAAALRKAKSPQDILHVVGEIRESKDAKRWRSWMREVREATDNGDLTIGKLTKHAERLRAVADIKAPTSTDGPDISIGLNVGVLSVGTGVERSKLRRLIRRDPHLRLLQSAAETGNVTPRFDPLLERVFGPKVGEAWMLYRRALRDFGRRDLSDPLRRHSPLSLMVTVDELVEITKRAKEGSELDMRRLKLIMQSTRATLHLINHPHEKKR